MTNTEALEYADDAYMTGYEDAKKLFESKLLKLQLENMELKQYINDLENELALYEFWGCPDEYL